MARLNISVPDPLYERLDHLRDQINASRVCSAALAHEVERVEGHPVPAGGQRERLIDRLVQRLRGTRELWYLRGREDAESWAADAASLDELTHVGERWPEHPSYDLEANDLPVSFQIWALVYKWELQDIWVPAGWDWLRTHLASRLRVHERQVRLGTEEGRHFMLRQLGYVQEPSGDAVRAFQKDQGLEENAYLGPAGWAALINAYIDKARLGEIDLGGSMSPAGIASVDANAFVAAQQDFQARWMKTAYLRGWHQTVREIWRDAKPRLQLSIDVGDDVASAAGLPDVRPRRGEKPPPPASLGREHSGDKRRKTE